MLEVNVTGEVPISTITLNFKQLESLTLTLRVHSVNIVVNCLLVL